MKLLLTSGGVTNPSIHASLVEMLDKPVSECSALVIPTAGHGHPWMTPHHTWAFVSGREPENPMADLGWASVGLLELAALPTIAAERWRSWVQESDVLLASGGDAMYLAHWMRTSGLADVLPSLEDKVWIGMSGGSMVMTPRIGREFVSWDPPLAPGDDTLGIVDFSICPHLAPPGAPGNTMEAAEKWAAGIGGPAYAMDDATAIRVVDEHVEVVSEGSWRFFPGE